MVEPALELPEPRPGERSAEMQAVALQHLAQVNEVYLRRYPGQWVVFERIWPPAGAQAESLPKREAGAAGSGGQG